jgi:ABC-type transport system substrate-binding protein
MEKRKVGRPTMYKPEFDNQAFKLCLLGHTDEELARYFEIEVSTLNKWKLANPKFVESIKAGREDADAEVSQALYKAAMGYSHTETVFHVVSDGNGLGSSIVATDTVKQYPPNERALRFWLMNRQRAKWTEKQEVGFTNKQGEDITPIVFNPAPNCKPLDETSPNE